MGIETKVRLHAPRSVGRGSSACAVRASAPAIPLALRGRPVARTSVACGLLQTEAKPPRTLAWTALCPLTSTIETPRKKRSSTATRRTKALPRTSHPPPTKCLRVMSWSFRKPALGWTRWVASTHPMRHETQPWIAPRTSAMFRLLFVATACAWLPARPAPPVRRIVVVVLQAVETACARRRRPARRARPTAVDVTTPASRPPPARRASPGPVARGAPVERSAACPRQGPPPRRRASRATRTAARTACGRAAPPATRGP